MIFPVYPIINELNMNSLRMFTVEMQIEIWHWLCETCHHIP